MVISPSNRAKCKLCSERIPKGERRVNFTGYLPNGCTHECYHVRCLKSFLKTKAAKKPEKASAPVAQKVEAAKAEERQEEPRGFVDTVEGISRAVQKVGEAFAQRQKLDEVK